MVASSKYKLIEDEDGEYWPAYYKALGRVDFEVGGWLSLSFLLLFD